MQTLTKIRNNTERSFKSERHLSIECTTFNKTRALLNVIFCCLSFIFEVKHGTMLRSLLQEQIYQNWKKVTRSEKKITFHSISKDSTLRSCWLDILNIKSVSNATRVCSFHFEEMSFNKGGSNITLKRNALPRKDEEVPSTPINMEVSIENIKVEVPVHTLLLKSKVMDG